MPTIDEELIQNAKAVFHGKVEHSEDVTFGKNAEFDGKVQINSAKDLATKDGTSFGYNVQRINAQDVLSQEDLLSLINALTSNTGKTFTFSFQLANSITNPTGDEIDLYLDLANIGAKGFFDLYFVKGSNQNGLRYVSVYTSYNGDIVSCGGMSLTGSNNNLTKIYGGAIVCKETQATLYRHTVEFSESGLGYKNRFTAYSEKNTPINSIQDLIAVFGNTKLMCTGTIEQGSNPCMGINIGTTADTILFVGNTGMTQKLSLWYSTGPESTLTITDNVTAM